MSKRQLNYRISCGFLEFNDRIAQEQNYRNAGAKMVGRNTEANDSAFL